MPDLDPILSKLRAKLLDREGCRLRVYLDTVGRPTVGYSHLVRIEDNLKLGDTISTDRALQLFESDMEEALEAALAQAHELNIEDEDFTAALGCVCYQLGADWKRKFYESYPALKRGDWDTALRGIKASLWRQQTEIRADDFMAAIRAIRQVAVGEGIRA